MVPVLEDTNLDLVRRIIVGLSSNDARPLIDALDEHVVWRSNSRPPHFRYGGEHRGRSGVLEMLAKGASEYAFVSYEPEKLTAAGDEVWAVCNLVAHHYATERTVSGRVAFCMTFRNGKIAGYDAYFDTASVLQQQGQLPD